MKLKVVESNREKRQRTKVEGGGRQGTRGPLGGGGQGGRPNTYKGNAPVKGQFITMEAYNF